MILETAVRRPRVGCDMGAWQGATTRWTYAPKKEPGRPVSTARLTRMRSALTHQVKAFVGQNVSIYQGFLADESGQLPFPG